MGMSRIISPSADEEMKVRAKDKKKIGKICQRALFDFWFSGFFIYFRR